MGRASNRKRQRFESRRHRYPYELPRIMPAGWTLMEHQGDGMHVVRERDGLSVILSHRNEYDGRLWLHVSFARPDRMPDHDDMKLVRALWTPRELTALQVLPPLDKYVNVHPYCLHLWLCLDGDVTPDFTREGLV